MQITMLRKKVQLDFFIEINWIILQDTKMDFYG